MIETLPAFLSFIVGVTVLLTDVEESCVFATIGKNFDLLNPCLVSVQLDFFYLVWFCFALFYTSRATGSGWNLFADKRHFFLALTLAI